MPRIAYVERRNLRADTMAIIELADRIATDYRRRGFSSSVETSSRTRRRATTSWAASSMTLGSWASSTGRSWRTAAARPMASAGSGTTRDIAERLSMFAERPIEVRRLALNMDQIEGLNPPPNPAKVTDSRFEAYRDLYGDESWELDAVEPEQLIDIIRSEIQDELDPALFNSQLEAERKGRQAFEDIADRWDEVTEFLGLD